MIIRSRDDFLELICIERVPDHLPTPLDMNCYLRIRSDSFAAEGTVWIAWPDYQRFLAQLRELEANRQGSADLLAMSPERFRLRIFTTNRKGHPAVEGSLVRVRYLGNQPMQQRLDFNFLWDAEYWSQVVRDFEQLPQTMGNQVEQE